MTVLFIVIGGWRDKCYYKLKVFELYIFDQLIMSSVPINYLAVLGATVVSMAIGFLWYGPLFGKKWMALSGKGQADMEIAKARGMGKLYALASLGSLVMSYVLAHSLVFASAYLNVGGVSAGFMAGFWNWLGFIAPVTLGSVLWEGKSWQLWILNNAYYLVSLSLMGILLAVWQ